MKYLIALIVIVAGIWGLTFLNKDTEEVKTITGTDTTVEAGSEVEEGTEAVSTTPTETGTTTQTTTTVAPKTETVTPKTETPSTPVSTTPAVKTVTVTYTDTGFSPATITVAKGDKVTFVNNSSGSMWVASDNHPTHTLYPEFDAKKAYNKGESYTFTFDKVGSWAYHNHLSASKKGTVVVK